jgi:Leucine-rich repeat (LRR) protein
MVRRQTIEPLYVMLLASVLVGCQQPPPPLSGERGTPNSEYQEAVSAAEKLGVVAYCDDEGEVTFLDFYGARDIPAAIVHVKEFPQLKMLNFSSSNLSDEDMEHLSTAKNVEELGLHGTQITNDGLVHIAGLANLRMLNLNDTQIGDAGLAHVSGLTNLTQLRLQSTQVTDAGLPHIEPLKNLVVVWLSGSQVTAEGAEQLRKVLPGADIVNDEIHEPSGEPLLPDPAFQQEE